jgi:hypothetical protein
MGDAALLHGLPSVTQRRRQASLPSGYSEEYRCHCCPVSMTSYPSLQLKRIAALFILCVTAVCFVWLRHEQAFGNLLTLRRHAPRPPATADHRATATLQAEAGDGKAAADANAVAGAKARRPTPPLLAYLSSCNATLQRAECEAVAMTNSSATCVLGKRSVDAGLGHQITEVLFWLRYARLEQAALLFEPLGAVVSNHKASYEFSNSFFGLKEAMESMHGVIVAGSDTNTSRLQCARVVRPGYTDCDAVCSCDCFFAARMSKLFAEYAPCLRQTSLCYGDWVSQARSLPFNPEVVNVAWHIRVGDLHLYEAASNFYSEVLGFMAPFLRGRKSVHYLIGGNGWDREHGVYVVRLRSIISDLGLAGASTVEPVFLSAKDSLLYLMSADITVSTSSSFSDIASLFSAFPVAINPPPKHGVFNSLLEYLPDGVYIDGPRTHTVNANMVAISLLATIVAAIIYRVKMISTTQARSSGMNISVVALCALAAIALINSFDATRKVNAYRPPATTSFQAVDAALFERLAIRFPAVTP